jgi:hypothetical protein
MGEVTPTERCQYNSQDLENTSLPDDRSFLPLRRAWWKVKRGAWYVAVLGPVKGASRAIHATRLGTMLSPRNGATRTTDNLSSNSPTLRCGDWVTVKSAKQIYSTLDEKDKLNGLTFTPEMVKFCGRQFKVLKVLNKIIVESTGELRRIKTPTVLLEGAFCDGAQHGGCDRSCLCFWREAWLQRIAPPQSAA